MRNLIVIFIFLAVITHDPIVAQSAAINVPLTVTDNSGGTLVLNFGLDPSATDGIDFALGESALPPLPPSGIFDARFNVINNESTLKDYRNGTVSYVGQKTHELQFQVGTGTTIEISWTLPVGITGTLKDVVLGTIINVPMQGTGNFIVSNPGVFNKLNMIIDYNLYTPLYTVNWQKCSSTGTLPWWFSTTHYERGLAFGTVNTNSETANRLYVVSRNNGSFVRVLNAGDGTDVDSLNTSGITGGTYFVNDVEVSGDNKIFVCNLTTDASSNPFKVYMWASETALPVAIINWTATEAVRLGDKITVVGNYSDNSAILYAASASSGIMKVYKWTMQNGLFNAQPTVISLSDNQAGTPSSASVGPLPNGDFYWKATGFRVKKYTATGTYIDTIPGSVVASGSNAVRYLGIVGNKEYLVVFQYGGGNENARIVEITAGNYAAATTYDITPTLGANVNTNGSGDVAIQYHPDGSATIFVLSTNNGIGSYKTISPVPVQLTSFNANFQNPNIILRWSTASELNSKEFHIERKGSDNQWTNIGCVIGSGNSAQSNEYTFTDKNILYGKCYYRLKTIDFDGSFEYSNVIFVNVSNPESFQLSQNYPNPFNPSTVINYQIPVNTYVSLKVFDVIGNEVATLVNQEKPAGSYEVTFDASNLTSGVYFYELQAGDFRSIKKLMLVK